MVYGKNTVVMSAGKSIPESDQYSAILGGFPIEVESQIS